MDAFLVSAEPRAGQRGFSVMLIFIAPEHGVDPFAQPRLIRELQQQLQGLLGNAIFSSNPGIGLRLNR